METEQPSGIVGMLEHLVKFTGDSIAQADAIMAKQDIIIELINDLKRDN